MNLDIYFKPIEKFEIKNNSIGSFCEFYEVNFPNWEEADIVVISVEQKHSFSAVSYTHLTLPTIE